MNDKNHKKQDKPATEGSANTGERGRAKAGHGSTTQGGPNFGQGSSQLGKNSLQQGAEGNNGSNYDKGLNEEAIEHKS